MVSCIARLFNRYIVTAPRRNAGILVCTNKSELSKQIKKKSVYILSTMFLEYMNCAYEQLFDFVGHGAVSTITIFFFFLPEAFGKFLLKEKG